MAEGAVSANRLELLQIADAVAREKSIDKSVVITAMEDAIQRAARSRYGAENEIRAEIDVKTGEMRLNRLLLVVEKVENEATEISLAEANAAIRRRPSATTSPSRCRPSISAASPPRTPSRSSCRRCAMPSASACMKSTRTASARSSMAR